MASFCNARSALTGYTWAPARARREVTCSRAVIAATTAACAFVAALAGTAHALDAATQCDACKLRASAMYARCLFAATARATSEFSADFARCDERLPLRWNRCVSQANGACDGADVDLEVIPGRSAVFEIDRDLRGTNFYMERSPKVVESVETEYGSALQGANDVAVSPEGRHVYVTGGTADSVAVFSRDSATGALAFVEGEFDGVGGVDGLGGPLAVAVSPDGRHVYVASGGADNAVAAFSRDATSGALTFVAAYFDGVGGVDGLAGANALALSPDGQHLYVTGGTDDAVAVFSRDAVGGTLTFVEALVDGTNGVDGLDGANSIAVSPDGAHAYATAQLDDSLAAFGRDATTGRLTLIEVERNAALNGASAVTLSPDGAFAYTAAREAGAIAVFHRSTATGALDLTQQITGLSPFQITVSPDARRVYGAGGLALLMLGRDARSGTLTLLARQLGVEVSGDFALSPDGRHLYLPGPGYVKTFRVVICGDGFVDAGEECEDGNTTGGDGCDAGCVIEVCFECRGTPSICTPKAWMDCRAGRQCRARKLKAAGNKAACVLRATADAVMRGETADTAICETEFVRRFTSAEARAGGSCPSAGDTAAIGSRVDEYIQDLFGFLPICGNSVADPGEQCDLTDAPDCRTLCQPDCTCPPPVCGNGVRETGEQCDLTDAPDCRTLCQPDCACPPPVCGNGVRETGEGCDGSDLSGCWQGEVPMDGCEDTCGCCYQWWCDYSAPCCGGLACVFEQNLIWPYVCE